MAVQTVYKASSEYRDPNTGTIYLDSAAKGRTNASTGNVTSQTNNANTGSSTVSSGTYKAKSSNYTPYSMSDETKQLKSTSQSYADEAADMEYSPSAYVIRYQNKLADVENSKPDAYVSKWQDNINGIMQDILNEKSFSYTGKDLMNDDMYKMYSDLYEKNARQAMQNAQGEAAGLTGGYGSSYSQAAGQQAYDDTMSGLNEIALTLADKAYEKYLNDRSDRYNKLSALNNQDNIDYSRYRDDVGDWQLDREYYAGRYNDTYDRDYNEFVNALANKQWMANYYASLYGQDASNDLQAWQTNRAADEFEANYELSKAEEARAAEKWDYDKQLLALQLQQAQQAAAQAAAGGSSSGGSYSRGSSSSSYPTTNKTGIDWEDVYALQQKAQASGKASDKKIANNALSMLSDAQKNYLYSARMSRGR